MFGEICPFSMAEIVAAETDSRDAISRSVQPRFFLYSRIRVAHSFNDVSTPE
jgi:hypothetical protein